MRRIEKYVPGIGLIRTYKRSLLKTDLVVAVTVFAILVPSALAYGELAGFEPVVGLYAALVAMIVYALFGSSRQLIIGPESTTAILVATVVAPLAGGDIARYASLAAALAILIGLICIIAGKFNMGFVADFFSKPILTGYIAGTALIVIASQLGKIFGISLVNDDFFAKIWELITSLDQTHLLTLAVGLVSILGLILIKRFAPRVPGTLVVLIAGIIVSSFFNLADLGVDVVGQVARGLPSLQVPLVSIADLRVLLPAALAMTVIIFADSVLTARVFARKNHYEIDSNQELVAFGAANVSTGLFQSFPVGGSASKTVVNDDSGGKSQMVGLIAAGFRSLNRVRHSEYYLAILTVFGVLVIGIISGIALAIGLSLIVFIQSVYRPHTSVLGTEPGVDGYHGIAPGAYQQILPGLIVYGFDAPLFFANAPYLMDQVMDLVSAADPPIKYLLLDAEAIPDIDTTAADTLKDIHQELRQKGITLGIARANKPLRETMRLAGLEDLIGASNFYPTIRTAIEAFRERSLGEM
jgi:SulP family sulfate permease